MGLNASTRGPAQGNSNISPNPWYPSLNVPQKTTVAPGEPLLPGCSFHISLSPSASNGSSSADIYLANTINETNEKQYAYYFTLRVQQKTDIKLRYTKSGQVLYTLHGTEVPLQSKGLNFERPLYIRMELCNLTYSSRSTLDVDLLYVENVDNYVGAPIKEDLCPDRLSFKGNYEIMELLLNHNTRKAFVDEPLLPGTKLYLTANRLNPENIYFIHVYLTNTSPVELNQGEVTLVPFDMTYYLDRCKSSTVIKLRHTWENEIASGRDGEGDLCDDSEILKSRLDIKNSIYVFVELCNMTLDVTRQEDDEDEKLQTRLAHLGGGPSKPPSLRSVHGQVPPIERARPRIRLSQNEGPNRVKDYRQVPHPQQNV